MTSMEERDRHHGETARNPQRRPVLTVAAGRRVPTEGNDDGSGAKGGDGTRTPPARIRRSAHSDAISHPGGPAEVLNQ